MNKETVIKLAPQRFERLLNISERATVDYNEARRLDISQIRSLIIQLTVLSFGAVGFSVPIIGNTTVVKNEPLFIIGLVILGITAIIGLWYLAISLENSIIHSYYGWKSNKDEINEALNNEYYLLDNPDKYDEYIKKQKSFVNKLDTLPKTNIKRDWFMYALLFSFTAGMVLIVTSTFIVA